MPWHVSRPALEEDLLAGTPLSVVRGPAGAGKSLLAASVLRRRVAAGGKVTWLDVSQARERGDIAQLLDRRERASREGVLVVLDAYDTRTDPGSDDDVLDALERDPGLMVLATSRRVTALESMRAGVRLGVRIVGPDALVLDGATVQAMAELGGVRLDDRTTARLLRVTGGVAVHVRTLLTAHQRGVVRLAAATDRTLLEIAAGAARDVVDLTVDPAMFNAWAALAVPDIVPRPLASALLNDVADATIDAAEREGIGSWDAREDVFELVPIARHMLREYLHRTDPGRERELLDRTAAAALERGDYYEGLRAAVLLHDYDTASRIVLERWFLMARPDAQRTVDIIDQVPRGELLRRPYLALTASICHNALPGHRARMLEHLAILLASIATRLPRADRARRASCCRSSPSDCA